MRRYFVILALAFLLAGCPNDDSTSGNSAGSAGQVEGNGDLYVETDNGSKQSAVVPEPATLALFGLGAAGLAALGARRKKKS